MATDCLGRKLKIGDWVAFTHPWKNSVIQVGRIKKIIDKRKDGQLRVDSKVIIDSKHNSNWCYEVNRDYYICLLEPPFPKLDGALGILEKYSA